MRGGETFSRRFSGLSEECLSAAIKFRDDALKILGEKRTGIPAPDLKTLGLAAPVPGITRDTTESIYKVASNGAKKARKPQKFFYELLAEEDAYSAAIACVEASLKAGGDRAQVRLGISAIQVLRALSLPHGNDDRSCGNAAHAGPEISDELAPVAAISTNDNGNGNGSLAVSRLG